MDKAYAALKKLAAPVGGDVFAGFSGYDLDVAKRATPPSRSPSPIRAWRTA